MLFIKQQSSTSGARYSGVPQKVFMVAPSVTPSLHSPKSVIFMWPSLSNMRFSSCGETKTKEKKSNLQSPTTGKYMKNRNQSKTLEAARYKYKYCIFQIRSCVILNGLAKRAFYGIFTKKDH